MSKRLVKYLVLLIGVSVLWGCRREPIIHLSDERRAELEQKQTQSESTPPTSTPTTIADPHGKWELNHDSVSYHLWDFLPFLPNQLKQYEDGVASRAYYMTYHSPNQAKQQIQIRSHNQLLTEVYQIENGQIDKVVSTDQLNPYDNVLEQLNQLKTGEPEVLLKEPLQLGGGWQDHNYQSEITALYKEITLKAGAITDVIEVSRQKDKTIIRDYYARNEGWVARWQAHQGDQQGKWQELVSDARDVRMTHPITIYQPTNNENELVKQAQGTFSWQTNGSLANGFQQMFRDQQWIDQSIYINQLWVDNQNVATIDFTPGVVAVLDEHPTSEAAVIQAIVRTVGDFLHTNQVRLTVNGTPMIPNQSPAPEGGIYQFDSPTNE